MDGNAKRSFTIALKKDPKTPCTCNGCPFGICTDYLALCPLPFGEEESSGSNKSLFFMRSKTSRGFIKFTKGRVGESTMRGINNDLNEILPEELRMKRVTAHSGRHTASTIAFNAGVDPVVVAKTTHHRDPKTFSGYAYASPSSKQVTGKAIGRAVFDNEEDEIDENNEENESMIGKLL